jgi:hypothetical protein
MTGRIKLKMTQGHPLLSSVLALARDSKDHWRHNRAARTLTNKPDELKETLR